MIPKYYSIRIIILYRKKNLFLSPFPFIPLPRLLSLFVLSSLYRATISRPIVYQHRVQCRWFPLLRFLFLIFIFLVTFFLSPFFFFLVSCFFSYSFTSTHGLISTNDCPFSRESRGSIS